MKSKFTVAIILLFLTFTKFSFAQISINETKTPAQLVNQDYTFSVEMCDDSFSGSERYVNLIYDFSKVNNSFITIEILPVLDCNNKSESINFRKPIYITDKDESFKFIDKRKITISDINSKCFKYQITIQSNTKTVKSGWIFQSFFM